MPKPLRAHASIARILGPGALLLGIWLFLPASLHAQGHGVSIFKSCVSPKNTCGSDADCADPNSCTGLGTCTSSGANHMNECTITLLNSDASLDDIRVNAASDTVFAAGGNQVFNNLPVSGTSGTVSGDCDVGTPIDPTMGCILDPTASISFISNQYVIQPTDPDPLPDMAAVNKQVAEAIELQEQIWRQAVAASRAERAAPAAPMLLLPALNAMIDITTTQMMATQMHPPTIVFIMLFGLALAASLLAGYGMTGSKARSWLHMVGFALVMAVSVYVILDLEYPRLGLIRVDAFDQALVDLRNNMK